MGQVEWSPTLQKIRNKIDLWISVVKKKMGGKVCRKLLNRKERKAHIYDTKELTLSQAITCMKASFKEYRATKKDAESLRNDFAEKLCENRAKKNNTTQESEKNKERHLNEQRRLARKVKSNRKDKQRTATLKVFRTDQLGQQVECITKAEVEEACIEENLSLYTKQRYAVSLGFSSFRTRLFG